MSFEFELTRFIGEFSQHWQQVHQFNLTVFSSRTSCFKSVVSRHTRPWHVESARVKICHSCQRIILRHGALPDRWVLLFSIDRHQVTIELYKWTLNMYNYCALYAGEGALPDPTPKFITKCSIMIKLRYNFQYAYRHGSWPPYCYSNTLTG